MKKRMVFFLVALLCGCTAGPDYQRPDVAEPAAFKYQDGWQTLPHQAWQTSGDWWLAFEDEQLTTLISRVTDNNQTLLQAEARFQAAAAQRRLSRSDYSPQLGAAASGLRSGGSNLDNSSNFGAELNINWAIDLWGQVRRQVEADAAALQGSAAELAAVQLTLHIAVAKSYLQLRALDQQKAILQQALDTYQRSAELTRNQYEAGIVSRADVIQADTQRQSLVSDLYDIEVQRAQEENTIAALIGVPPSDFTLADTAQLPMVPVLPASLPATLIARRPDVVAAERQVAAANARIGVAQTAWLPALSFNVRGGIEADNFSSLLDAPVRVWSLGPQLAQTLFDAGKRHASKDIAIAQYDEQVARYRQTVLDSLRDVENALATVDILAEKDGQQEKLIALAEQNEALVTNRYRAGLVTYLEVATVQNITLNARKARVTLTAQRLAGSVDLAAALGGGWSLDAPDIDKMTAGFNTERK